MQSTSFMTSIGSIGDLGPFSILEDLGPAPFGTAYLALDTRSDQAAIVKVILPSRPGIGQEITPWEILLEETAALARIYHRGLPPLLEVVEHEGALLVAFGPVEGRTLHELLSQGVRPDRAQLIDWGCQILDVLGEAHAEGLLHRHVGEDSVMITPEGQVVLTGFGLTQLVFHPLTALSPEQLAGEPLTPQSDLFAVGSLLRRLTFASRLKSAGAVVGSNGRDPLLKVLARATFPDPSTRFRSAADMEDALRQAGRVQPAMVIPAAPASPASAPGLTTLGVPGIANIADIADIANIADTSSTSARVANISAPARIETAAVAPFPAAARTRPSAGTCDSDGNDRRWALLLLTVTLLLMLSVIATGWFLIGGGDEGQGSEAATTSRPEPARAP